MTRRRRSPLSAATPAPARRRTARLRAAATLAFALLLGGCIQWVALVVGTPLSLLETEVVPLHAIGTQVLLVEGDRTVRGPITPLQPREAEGLRRVRRVAVVAPADLPLEAIADELAHATGWRVAPLAQSRAFAEPYGTRLEGLRRDVTRTLAVFGRSVEADLVVLVRLSHVGRSRTDNFARTTVVHFHFMASLVGTGEDPMALARDFLVEALGEPAAQDRDAIARVMARGLGLWLAAERRRPPPAFRLPWS